MGRFLEYGTYIVFAVIVGGFTTYFFPFVVGIFLSVLILGASDELSPFSLIALLILPVFSILYGLSVFGFFSMLKYFLGTLRIQLRVFWGKRRNFGTLILSMGRRVRIARA